MTDVDVLFARFRASYETGAAIDIAVLLEEADGDDRDGLQQRLHAFLATAPRRRMNEDAYERSRASRSVRQAIRRARADG